MITTTIRNKEIKKALVKVFGNIVSVTGSTGTAYGWANIKVNKMAEEGEYSKADAIIKRVWDENDGGYYLVDDGFSNHESTEYLLSFNL